MHVDGSLADINILAACAVCRPCERVGEEWFPRMLGDYMFR